MAEYTVQRIWKAAADRAFRLGATPLNRLPGCWYQKLDGGWEVAVNAHKEARGQKFEYHDCRVKVPPFSMYAEFNGWPAATLNLKRGEIAAGSLANADSLIAALEAM